MDTGAVFAIFLQVKASIYIAESLYCSDVSCLRLFAYRVVNLRILLEPLAEKLREVSRNDSFVRISVSFIFSYVTFYSTIKYLPMNLVLCPWGLFWRRVFYVL